MGNDSLAKKILDVIPKDSIGRYDLFPVFYDAELFKEVIQYLAAPYIGKVNYVASPEAIGWIIGSAMAKELNIGFIPLRKANGLPYQKELIISQKYVDYSGKAKELEIKKDSVIAGDKILIVDEWVETGASLHCCIKLLEKLGGIIVGLASIGTDYKEGTKEWIDSGFIHFVGKDM